MIASEELDKSKVQQDRDDEIARLRADAAKAHAAIEEFDLATRRQREELVNAKMHAISAVQVAEEADRKARRS